MVNIEATNIERGVTVNPAKKVKISKWEDLVRNAKEVETKADVKNETAQPDFNVSDKPEWEVVNTSFENVDVERNAKPIRVAEESFNNIEQKGNKVREDNYTEENEVDYSVPTFDYENNKTLEDYGFTKELSDAVDTVVNTPEFNEPEFEIPKFEEYEEEENTIENEKDSELDFEEMIKKALDESFEREETKVEETNFEVEQPKEVESTSEEEVSISANNLQINDLMKELAQLSEANDTLKGSIATIEDRNTKMEKSITGIENETKSYDEISLKNARELLLKAKEEQQALKVQEENAINTGKDLKDRLISADEANLSAKKRSDYLKEMLSEHNYQPEEDNNVKTFAA